MRIPKLGSLFVLADLFDARDPRWRFTAAHLADHLTDPGVDGYMG